MELGVVEEFALLPQSFVEDLGPLGARIDPALERRDVHRAVADFRRSRGRNDAPARARADAGGVEQLLSVGRQRERANSLEERRRAPARVRGRSAWQAKLVALEAHRGSAGAFGDRLRVEDHAGRSRGEVAVVGGGHVETEYSLTDVREVDAQNRIGLRARRRSTGGFVTRLGQEGRRVVRVEHREIHRAPRRAIDGAHLDPAGPRTVVGAGEEVEILAARVEARRRGVGERVGELPGLLLGERAHEDGAHVAVETLRVRDPSRVRRPRGLEAAARRVVLVLVELRRLARRDVDRPQVQMVVVDEQQLSVRRPLELGEIARAGERDRARRAEARLVGDHELVVALRVGEPRQLRAVGGPHRVSIVRARRLRQVAPITLVGRNREDVAARFECRAHAGGREARVADHARDALELRASPREIADDVDRERFGLTRLDVEEVDDAVLLVDDRVGSGGRRHDVGVVVVRQLLELLRREVVREQVARVVAIGEEVHGVADPHRIAVVAVLPRQLFDGGRRQVDDADRVRAAAAIVAPHAHLVPVGNERRRDFFEGDARSVRRMRAGERARHRESLLEAAGGRDGEHPEIRGLRRARAVAGEDDALSVGRPSAGAVVSRMERESCGLTAGRRDDVDVGVAVRRAAERDVRSVGREVRIRLDVGRRREPARRAARTGRDP